MISRLFSNWFTGPGDHSYEVGRALWALSVIAGIGFAGWDMFGNHNHFNAVEYGTGIGSLLALGGVGIAFKDRGAVPPQPSTVGHADNVNVGEQ